MAPYKMVNEKGLSTASTETYVGGRCTKASVGLARLPCSKGPTIVSVHHLPGPLFLKQLLQKCHKLLCLQSLAGGVEGILAVAVNAKEEMPRVHTL